MFLSLFTSSISFLIFLDILFSLEYLAHLFNCVGLMFWSYGWSIWKVVCWILLTHLPTLLLCTLDLLMIYFFEISVGIFLHSLILECRSKFAILNSRASPLYCFLFFLSFSKYRNRYTRFLTFRAYFFSHYYLESFCLLYCQLYSSEYLQFIVDIAFLGSFPFFNFLLSPFTSVCVIVIVSSWVGSCVLVMSSSALFSVICVFSCWHNPSKYCTNVCSSIVCVSTHSVNLSLLFISIPHICRWDPYKSLAIYLWSCFSIPFQVVACLCSMLTRVCCSCFNVTWLHFDPFAPWVAPLVFVFIFSRLLPIYHFLPFHYWIFFVMVNFGIIFLLSFLKHIVS